ncbi:MAG: hypothetical protein CMJ78_11770 [Planctomycetaceae bacterium]|nr:hypothetical protein [Planctomycetaceae bacterium]
MAAFADRARADSGITRPAKNVILVYLLGGPPHQDMWDLKPQAPKEVRGPFQPISTSAAGIQICEHLPKIAQHADKLTILRSLAFANNDHPYMTYHTLTGRISPVPLGANTVLPPTRSDHPHMGSIISKYFHQNSEVPGYVAVPEVFIRMGPQLIAGGGRAGYLGPQFDPLPINDDPSKPLPTLDLPENVSADRFRGRQKLLAVLDGKSPRAARARVYQSQRQTASRLTAGRNGGLLDLDAEPAALHERYGKDRFGQSLLLSRRLVERGVSFVGVHFNYMSKCDGWDTHKNNFKCLKDELLPMLDRGLSTLLDDLRQRGLLDETLVVTMGEFGRTPRINGNAGRDHWGHCSSVVLAGGPTRGGTVIGESDATAAYPKTRPVAPADLTASIFHALGMDPEQLMYDRLNRPLPLSPGQVIHELFG